MKKFWRAETGIFLAVWLVLLVGGRSNFFRDPGTFWHTIVGEQMLSTHHLIYADGFSFTFAGQRWSPHQWLGECLMALVHRIDGLDTLLLASATLLACLYTWLAARLIRAGIHWAVAAVLVALTIAASSSHFHIRPHLGTIVGMGLTLGFLCDFDSGRIGMRGLYWLVPMYWLWTNIHGGMLGGLATIALAVMGWAVWRALGWPSPLSRYRQLVPLGLLIALCGLTAVANPYGLRLPQIWMEIMDSPVLPQIIKEHAPLQMSTPDGLMVILFAGIYLTVLVGVFPERPRVSWLLPLVWLYLGWSRVRHAPLFAITAAVAMGDMFPHTRWAEALQRAGSDLFQPAPPPSGRQMDWRPALLPIGLVVLALLLQTLRVSAPVIGHQWARLDPAYWPVENLPALVREEPRRARSTDIFNEYLFGGFLIYFTPGYRVLVDDRCELYGDRWLEDYVHAEERDPERFVQKCERNYAPFRLALTRNGSRFDDFFGRSPAWRCLSRGQAATLYERNTGAGPGAVAASGP